MTWSNPSLFDELRKADSLQGEGTWALWHSRTKSAPLTHLKVQIGCPKKASQDGTARQLASLTRSKLSQTLKLYAKERGWPQPLTTITLHACQDDSWYYRLSLPPLTPVRGEFIPGKCLALADGQALSSLIGLPTTDPMLNLPAKWIGASQRDTALASGIYVLEIPELLCAHALTYLATTWHLTLSYLDIERWLLPILAEHQKLVEALTPDKLGSFLQATRELIAADLWLPPTAHYLESFLRVSTSTASQSHESSFDTILDTLRSEIGPFNIPRYYHLQDKLRAIEWVAPQDPDPNEDEGASTRRLTRLTDLILKHSTSAPLIILTEPHHGGDLRKALRSSSIPIPVFSWSELPTDVNLEILGVVDARFPLDPSPWPALNFISCYATIEDEEIPYH